MKSMLICLIISALVLGCAGAKNWKRFGVDYKFRPVVGEVINVDGYRVLIKVIKVSDFIYDVMAYPNTDDLSYSELNRDFLSQYSRSRKGAEIILRKQIGKGKEITIIDDMKPTSWLHLYLRFKVTEAQ